MEFGFFKGMNYGECEDVFEDYKKFRNQLPKETILNYLKNLPIAAIAPMSVWDIFTGEYLELAGLMEDGNFIFPIDFIHYYEKYPIGIPEEYEKYIIEKMREKR